MGDVAKLILTAGRAQERIRRIAKDSGNIILSKHAKEQMGLRDIVRHDIDRVLRNGYVDGNPSEANEGEWKCKMTLPIKGRRDLGVVVILLRNGKLFVKTTEWEDPK